jgi:hypothetical protein
VRFRVGRPFQLSSSHSDTAFPIRFSILDPRVLISKANQDAVLESIKRSIPSAEATDVDLQVEEVQPRDKDGGAFVRVSYLPVATLFSRVRGTADQAKQNDEIVGEAIESWVRRQVKKSGAVYKPWFVWGPDQLYLVKVRQQAGHVLRLTLGAGQAVYGGHGQVPEQQHPHRVRRWRSFVPRGALRAL